MIDGSKRSIICQLPFELQRSRVLKTAIIWTGEISLVNLIARFFLGSKHVVTCFSSFSYVKKYLTSNCSVSTDNHAVSDLLLIGSEFSRAKSVELRHQNGILPFEFQVSVPLFLSIFFLFLSSSIKKPRIGKKVPCSRLSNIRGRTKILNCYFYLFFNPIIWNMYKQTHFILCAILKWRGKN